MKQVCLVIFICCITSLCFAQSFINDSQGKVRKKLAAYAIKNDLPANIIQTDSKIQLSIKDTRRKPAEFIFLFSQNKCVEEIKLACDSCVMKYLNESLIDRTMGWQKMNDSTYLAKYSKHRIMLLHLNGNASSLRIKKLTWDRKAYKGIVKSL